MGPSQTFRLQQVIFKFIYRFYLCLSECRIFKFSNERTIRKILNKDFQVKFKKKMLDVWGMHVFYRLNKKIFLMKNRTYGIYLRHQLIWIIESSFLQIHSILKFSLDSTVELFPLSKENDKCKMHVMMSTSRMTLT